MHQLTFIPHVKICPSKLVFYNVIDGLVRPQTWVPNFHSNKPQGYISYSASKRIRIAIEWLLYFSPSKMVYYHDLKKKLPFKLSFLTLTLPAKQVHSDKIIKSECINQFNIELRKKFKIDMFLWKAESQKNGNIHFHYTLNKYVYWKEIQSIWNRITNKLGYVDRFAAEWQGLSFSQYCAKRNISGKKEIAQALKAYDAGQACNWTEPNSVDVHSVKKIQKLDSYLVKYFLKNDEDRRPIDGHLWSISESLSKFKGWTSVVGGSIAEELYFIQQKCKSLMKYFDWSSICKIDISGIKAYLPESNLIANFLSYISEIKKQYAINFD